MIEIQPYLFFNGRCEEAIEFYKQAFNAEELFRFPMPDGKLGHAEIRIGDSGARRKLIRASPSEACLERRSIMAACAGAPRSAKQGHNSASRAGLPVFAT